MSQVISDLYKAQNARRAKSIDYALVIAGWPAIYTVARGSYALPATGVISAESGFASLSDSSKWANPPRAWANIPQGVGGGTKGRPEEGGTALGEVQISVLDRVANGRRELSDLAARQAYLEGVTPSSNLTAAITSSANTIAVANASQFPPSGILSIEDERIRYTSRNADTFLGCTRGQLGTTAAGHAVGASVSAVLPAATLASGIGPQDTPITLTDASDFPAGPALIYIGLECIRYESKTSNTLNSCTRGYLLTSRTAHAAGLKVYSYVPSLYRRPAFLFAGYQDLSIAEWMPIFGGIIHGFSKCGASMNFTLMQTMWETYADAQRQAFLTARVPTAIINDALSGDFALTLSMDSSNVDLLNNGHYMIRAGGAWAGIVDASTP